MKNLITQSWLPIALALFGGLVSLFTRPTPFSVRFFLGGLFAAAFVGLLINIACIHFQYPETVKAVAVSLGGYCARDLLALAREQVLKVAAKKMGDK